MSDENNENASQFPKKEETAEDYASVPLEESSKTASTSTSATGSALTSSQRMFVDANVLNRSLAVLRLAVVADAVTATILQPNYPIMATPNAHEDSFTDTAPFDFNAATYFIPMTALLGVGVASVVIGGLSDKVGRRPCVLVCLYGSVVWSILKYFLRDNFWAFCAVNFANGLFSATTPLAMAYMSDVFSDKDEKTLAIGMVGAFNMVGTSGGGICAILMENQGLFTPLWIGVALMILASILNTLYLSEPYRPASKQEVEPDEETVPMITETETKDVEVAAQSKELPDGEEESEHGPPETLDQCTLWNIIGGAFADNVGTAGLNPMCLSPLAFKTYYASFDMRNMDPILSLNGYKWLSTLVALTIIPSAMVSPKIFAKLGASGGCVLGNVVTAVVTISLLYIALEAPTTKEWFYGFVAVLYVGFPFTVFSQLSTGPMLDVISPLNKRGYTQGLNTSVMNFGTAITPWALGLLADATDTKTAIWTCIGISLVAAVINTPLIFRKGLGPAPSSSTKVPAHSRPLSGEEKDLVEKALRGEYIPAAVLDDLNEARIQKGDPFLLVHYGNYEEDRERLPYLKKNALVDFKHLLKRRELYVGDLNSGQDKEKVCEKMQTTMSIVDADALQQVNGELGVWFTDYLQANGYNPHMSTTLTKQMIMSAFPPIARGNADITPENVEERLLNSERVYRRFVQLETEEAYANQVKRMLATQGPITFV